MNLARLHTRQEGGGAPYRIQYAPVARSLLNGLEKKVRAVIEERMYAASQGDPYAHGAPSFDRDRRTVEIEDVKVVFVVSEEVRVLTVVDLLTED